MNGTRSWTRTTIKRPAHERFWEKVEVRGPDECWRWTGYVGDTGYGQFWDGTRLVKAHRYLIGTTGDLVVDHTCHNESGCVGGVSCEHRSCVNPIHLEVVTFAENVRRGMAGMTPRASKAECAHGHAYDEENTYIDPKGHQRCRACNTDRQRRIRKAAA